MILIKKITPAEELAKIVDEINRASWDEDNEMLEYGVESLAAYIKRQDTIFITCHDVSSGQATLMGVASSRLEIKPHGKEPWLYVDEVNVCSDQRQKGAGKAIMRHLIEFARESGCEEVWLATEADNTPAKALYQSLDPDDVAEVVGYTFETHD